jgi:hypothetical protein
MTDASEATGRDSLSGPRSPILAPLRLAIGLTQGVALWWLYNAADTASHQWPATVPALFAPLLLIAAFVPVLLLAGVGRMRMTTLAGWALGAVAFLVLLGWHEVARQSAETLDGPPFLNGPMPLFAAAALFIGHHLILASDMERKWIAAFPTYFDTAWKAGVQLALSLGFTAAFWILLFLGAGLFRVIGLDFLEDLIRKEWFAIPVTTFAFAIAVHLTDVRDGLIRGVRTVVLMLLSWLLLVITVLVAGFLAALPFTGLSGLWETGSATSLVLAAAAALIILINTAYQDGRPDNLPPLVLRIAVRAAAVLITPLIVIAFWGLSLRIGQHGLTPDRIIALACAVVGAAYAVGYGWAALSPFWRKSDWMRPLERTNVWTAVLTVAVILALFSPLADPARLSVADQTARLQRGAVAPDKFDYRFLRFESGKAGKAALARLARSADPAVASRAKTAQAVSNRWDRTDVGVPERTPVFEVYPAGAALPTGFVAPVPPSDRRYACTSPGECVAAPMDMNGDDRPEVLIASSHTIVLWTVRAGKWEREGDFNLRRCPNEERADPRELLRSGAVRPARPTWSDLTVGAGPARRLDVDSRIDCAIVADAATAD